jgi:hypothetical protein
VSIYFYKEYIIVFGVDLILGINLRYIVIDFIIVNLFRVGSIILKENSLFSGFFFFFFFELLILWVDNFKKNNFKILINFLIVTLTPYKFNMRDKRGKGL